MKRSCELGIGLANLGDQVRVVDRDGSALGFMTVVEAQKRASEQHGELVVILRTEKMTVVRIVKDAARDKLRALKKLLGDKSA
jgi:translation initiation factor IF-3